MYVVTEFLPAVELGTEKTEAVGERGKGSTAPSVREIGISGMGRGGGEDEEYLGTGFLLERAVTVISSPPPSSSLDSG
jgi:hypothetical protein